MPVFLSHKREDKVQTMEIARYLRYYNIRCYVDVLDPDLQSTNDITSKIRERIDQCSHLMAVVSKYTESSWWVPFEIGVGTEKDRRITSYQLTDVKLPDFLTKWPVLRRYSDLDKFIEYYKKDQAVESHELFEFIKSVRSAEQFHRELKARLYSVG